LPNFDSFSMSWNEKGGKGKAMIWWILQNFVVTAFLAGCVWAVCRSGRIGPVGQHALWLVLLVKLLMPPLVNWPWAIRDLVPDAARAAVAPIAKGLPLYRDRGPVARTAAAASGVINSRVVRRPFIALRDWLWPTVASVWFAGFAIFVLVQAERIRRMLRLLRIAVPAGPELTSLVDEVAERLKVSQIETRLVPGIASPFIWCVRRPLLLWPAALSQDIPADSIRGLLVHELAHLKRRDHWVGWLELAAGCLWWWNPLYWCIRHQLRENAELACDAWAVEEMDSIPKGRRAYAEALLSVCASLSSDPKHSNPMPAIGVDTGNRRFLERRLTMIVRERLPFRLSRAGIVVIAFMALAVLPVWTLRAAPEQVERREARVVAAVPQELPKDARDLRQQFIKQLQTLQDTHTKAGRLDEALAVRDEIRRFQGIEPSGLPESEKTQGILNRNVKQTNFVNTPFRKAIEELQETTEANIYVPWKLLSAAGIDENAPVNLKVRDVPLGRVLRLILTDATGDNRLAYEVDGGVIEIVTTEEAERHNKKEFFGGLWEGGRFLERAEGEPAPFGRTDLTSYRGFVGESFRVPLNGAIQGAIWGTDVFTDDTDPNVAAVHAGLLQPGQKGIATIKIMPGQDSYTGSLRNGVRSRAFQRYPGSYRIERVDPMESGIVDVLPIDVLPTNNGLFRVEPSWSRDNLPIFFVSNVPSEIMAMRGRVGETLELEVTGTTRGQIWGTDVYTDDTDPNVAAVHAGLLKPGETGKVRITILPGRERYEGSNQNGVRSGSFRSWDGSYRIERLK
jgi:beta-lactamase regulating signal transducer with metallopeptidase domain